MNFILLILLFIFKTRSSKGENQFCDSHKCDNWSCRREEDNTLTVIMDCNKNLSSGTENKTTVWLWSLDFPDDMKTLILQNCNEVTIQRNFPFASRRNFQVLHIRNVSDLILKNNMPLKENLKHIEEIQKLDYYYKYPRPCFPDKVIFESVKNIRLDKYDDNLSTCRILKSLKLINVGIDEFNLLYKQGSAFDEFVMDNVNIENIGLDAIHTSNKEALISVRNSNINSSLYNVISCNCNEVIIANNTFKYLNGKKAFVLQAQKIVLEGNTLPSGDNAFDLTAPNIQITNNIFHHLKENFITIKPIFASKSTSYNFSNNVINHISPGAFYSWQTLFDSIETVNNSINCTCKNMHWFHSIADEQDNFHKKILRIKWLQTKNNNQCLNIPNCSISQVLENYLDLCDEDFTCLEKRIDLQTDNSLMENNYQENAANSFLNNETDGTSLKLLQILGEIKNCFIVLLFISFSIIISVVIKRIWKNKTSQFSLNRKEFIVKTDMDSSSMTELCSVPNKNN